MITPEALIAEARSWVHTPFHHGARLKGVGVDCVGLIVGIASVLRMPVHDRKAYPLRPNGELRPIMDRLMTRVDKEKARPSDVLLMAFNDEEPHHLAIYTGATIIHAYIRARKCVEQPMHEYWWAHTVGAYRWPGLAR